MYYKQYFGTIEKGAELPSWVKWTHHSEGKTHCEACLMLDGCWFMEGKAPPCPHHPYCHCTLDPVPYAVVMMNAASYSDYSKFDPYLFDPGNYYKHGKNKAFESWGYTVADALWLKAEIERQAQEKYVIGDYTLGVLDRYGQRISIRIELPRKDRSEEVSFLAGWTVCPNGQIRLNTPYGGK